MDILTTYNPSTGEKLADYPLMQQEELDRRLQEAGEAYRYWSALEVAQRSFAVGNLARELDRDLDDLARLMSEEMGKIRPEAEAELKKCI
ncbi:MAG: aldehyde dehydrogenase family protein, partial [Chitinophagales bacterium]|nr:aldehyde dehydrogenase family protein [Chitinophagales bacterium]